MEKMTIVINGVGGCGKDTLAQLLGNHYKVINISSITPIKELAKLCGWDGVKTDKARKFLSDLKILTADFCDFPTNYILEKQKDFLDSDREIMFVHIREASEIKKFVAKSKGLTKTLLVEPREELQKKLYGNVSDDDVKNYNYDYVYSNNKKLSEVEEDFLKFFETNMLKK